MRVLTLLVAAAAFAAGCLDAAPPPAQPTATDADETPPTPWRPNPPGGHEPRLAPGSAFVPTEWGYVRADFEPPATPTPVILTMNGYEGAADPTHYLRVRDGVLVGLAYQASTEALDGYAVVTGSIRGTGCSGGAFDLFDRTHALDGYEVVEWLARENWTDGVGLAGGSYTAITALHIASTSPPSLKAVAVSAVIGDIYRDTLWPGGVLNQIFPVFWGGAFRPAVDATGTAAGLGAADEICAQNVATRGPGAPLDHAVTAAARATDGTWYAARNVLTFVDGIRAPVLLAQGVQDEETGPRAGYEVFAALKVEKRLLVTNGWHFTTHGVLATERQEWFDHFVRGLDNGALDRPAVEVFLGTRLNGEPAPAGVDWDGVVGLDAWPATNTSWTRWYLREGGALDAQAPAAEAADRYAASSPAPAWVTKHANGVTALAESPDARGAPLPDRLVYTSEPFDAPRLLAGPIAATLHLSTTATDTDLYVAVGDVHPDGSVTWLTRGLLRASHRALDEQRSVRLADGSMLRPYHPHTDPGPVAPGEVLRYEVEVFPAAHVFHEGHALRVLVTTPPPFDGLWGYAANRAPAVNTLHHDAERSSSVLVGFVPWDAPLPPEPACGVPDGYGCAGATDGPVFAPPSR